MNATEIKEVKRLLQDPKKIVIVPHKNPDGDAIGSTLALKHYLTNCGHVATVISPNEYPSFLKWIPGEDSIVKYDSNTNKVISLVENADLIFTLDFNHLSRRSFVPYPRLP